MERWCPDEYLRSRYPSVRVEETALQGRLQGCLERDKGIIWLSIGLTPIERRCTLAEEIGQLHLGPTPEDPCMAAMHRRAAVDWAARMLISSEEFVEAWANCLDLVTMAAYCDVDLPMFRARIRAASDADQDAAMTAIINSRLSA